MATAIRKMTLAMNALSVKQYQCFLLYEERPTQSHVQTQQVLHAPALALSLYFSLSLSLLHLSLLHTKDCMLQSRKKGLRLGSSGRSSF